MKILVLNWGVAEEYSWQHTLFNELSEIGAEITVVSAKRSWEPRGFRKYPEHEDYGDLKYYRMFEDIPDFKTRLGKSVDEILSHVGNDFDILWTFHQANWLDSQKFLERLKCKSVLVCEQAFRTSGLQAGTLTARWREIQKTTDLIISWAPVDEKNEEAIGCKYLPFGGCYPDIEQLLVRWGHKWRKPYAIYQGTLSGFHKNQDALFSDIKMILDSDIVDYFVINGYPIDDNSKRILDKLSKNYKERFHYELLVGRDKVFQYLRGAVFGYSPMKPFLLSNFPFEAFGAGVPMYMPYLEDRPDFVIGEWKRMAQLCSDRSGYEKLVQEAKGWYDMNLSVEVMGQQYYNALEGIL